MFTPGEFAILALIALVATLFGVVMGQRCLRRALERRQRRRWLRNEVPPTAQLPSRRALLGVAAVQMLLLGICAGVDLSSSSWPAVTFAAGVLLILSVLFMHGLPQQDRTAKYVSLWIGTYLCLISGVMSAMGDRRSSLVYWQVALVPGTFLVAAALCGVVRNSAMLRRGPWLQGFLVHRLYMMLTPGLSVSGWIAYLWLTSSNVLLGYLLLRYLVRPCVSRHPFMYLRSFADASARPFVAKILAPALGMRGVVLGLVHEKQTGEDLHRSTDEAWYAHLLALPDFAWQSWVSRNLGSCTGVVIDMSVASASLAWELEQAQRYLPPDRILVVSRTVVPDPASAAGVNTLVYSLKSRSGVLHARAALESWSGRALESAISLDVVERPSIRVSKALSLVSVAVALWAASFTMPLFVHAIAGPTSSPVTTALDLVWYSRCAMQSVAATLVLCASSMFPVGGVRSARASHIWLATSSALVALCSLWCIWGQYAAAAIIVSWIATYAPLVALGCILLSCLEAYALAGREVKLHLVTAMLLPSLANQRVWPGLWQTAVSLHTTWPLWIGVLVILLCVGIATSALIMFIWSALQLRARQ